MEGRTRKCLFFYVKMLSNNSVVVLTIDLSVSFPNDTWREMARTRNDNLKPNIAGNSAFKYTTQDKICCYTK